VPVTQDSALAIEANSDLVTLTKEYISDEKYRIRLDDLAVQCVKRAKSLATDTNFPVDKRTETNEEFIEEFTNRLSRYESLTHDLQVITALLAHWGNSAHISTIKKIMTRISELPKHQSGAIVWLNLPWYPTVLLMYSGGIGAIAADNYENLFAIFNTNSGSISTYEKTKALILETNDAMLELNRTNIFKSLPGHEKNHVPWSEYLFKTLQPILDDLLFLGSSYEELFDRFEIFQALVYADLDSQNRSQASVWGPFGRFSWKHRSRSRESSPYVEVISEAKAHQDNWPPLKAGLFGGSFSRFENIANEYQKLLDGRG
jgi:hypothetical protein